MLTERLAQGTPSATRATERFSLQVPESHFRAPQGIMLHQTDTFVGASGEKAPQISIDPLSVLSWSGCAFIGGCSFARASWV